MLLRPCELGHTMRRAMTDTLVIPPVEVTSLGTTAFVDFTACLPAKVQSLYTSGLYVVLPSINQ